MFFQGSDKTSLRIMGTWNFSALEASHQDLSVCREFSHEEADMSMVEFFKGLCIAVLSQGFCQLWTAAFHLLVMLGY